MKNIPVSLHRRKLLPAIPVLLYFINLQYVYRNIFIKNKFLQGAVLFFSKYIFVKRRTEDLGTALKPFRSVSGHAPAKLALRREGTEKFKGAALKPYRPVSGHAPANFALTEQWFMLTTAHFALQSNFLRKLVCIRTTFLMKSLSLQH